MGVSGPGLPGRGALGGTGEAAGWRPGRRSPVGRPPGPLGGAETRGTPCPQADGAQLEVLRPEGGPAEATSRE